MSKFLLSVLLTLSLNVNADEVKGLVTWVTDGDTITVKRQDTGESIKVRLAQIDAPETSHYGSLTQPYGNESAVLLKKTVYNKTVSIYPSSVDYYGRTIAEVFYRGVDINKFMVSKGAAWAYTTFVIDESIFNLQNKAKNNRIGLWSDVNAVPPWQWRKEH